MPCRGALRTCLELHLFHKIQLAIFCLIDLEHLREANLQTAELLFEQSCPLQSQDSQYRHKEEDTSNILFAFLPRDLNASLNFSPVFALLSMPSDGEA